MQILKLLDVMTIVLAGLLVGVELAIAAFIHPTLERLEDATHRAAASAIAAVLGGAMPPWYAVVFVLIGAEAWIRHSRGEGVWLLVAAGTIWAATIVLTVMKLVPINNRVAKWTKEKFDENWQEERSRWDGLHRFRVAALMSALICVVMELLG